MRSRGFTVAETILAFGLVAIALLAVVGLFTSSFRLQNRSTSLTTGTEIAREQLEVIKLLGRDAPPPIDAEYDGSVPTPQEDSGFPPPPYPFIVREGIIYTLSIKVEPAPDTATAKVVTVQVSWKDGGKAELQTYL
jgi:type II secretory pathway pseudopilin PulG